MSWRVVFTKQAQKDARKLASAGLRPNAERLLQIIAEDPLKNPPPFEKLIGNLGPPSSPVNSNCVVAKEVIGEVRANEVKNAIGSCPSVHTYLRPKKNVYKSTALEAI